MPSGTGLTEFAERQPTRFHDVGICEQHGVAMAAGMAKGGLRPVCEYTSCFRKLWLYTIKMDFCNKFNDER